MLNNPTTTSGRVLEPMDRISEVLFALIMVLTFTCSFSVAEAGREDVRAMLIGVLGCNLAWGVIDAVLYLMGCFSSRGQNVLNFKALREADDATEGRRIVASALPPLVASVLSSEDLESVRSRLLRLSDIPDRPRLGKREWLGAIGVFLIVVLTTFPVMVPFLFTENARLGLRISNWIAVGLLFLTGYAFGRYAGHRPWRMALAMVLLGAALVAITIFLGG